MSALEYQRNGVLKKSTSRNKSREAENSDVRWRYLAITTRRGVAAGGDKQMLNPSLIVSSSRLKA